MRLITAIRDYVTAIREARASGYAPQESYAEWYYYDGQHRAMTEDGDRSPLGRFAIVLSAPVRFVLQQVVPVPPAFFVCSLVGHTLHEELLSAESGHSELCCTRCGHSTDIWM